MFLLRKPSDERIRRFLAAQARTPFSYPEVGASRGGAPSGYPVNHLRCRLGTGGATFARASRAIRHWAMYRTSWTRLCFPDVPVAEGAVVCVLARHFGFWSLNPCRVIYVLEGGGAVERFGFAFGTLPEHTEQGEERFTVEWHRADDAVWYELFAFARPHHALAKIGSPLVRSIQRRFAEDSQRAMREAVKE